ncbi:MAG: hypothetical protein MZU79_07030 [Anaerotruncus sp.]|nr:hypothetical protein [Anaerotruncus sp.]
MSSVIISRQAPLAGRGLGPAQYPFDILQGIPRTSLRSTRSRGCPAWRSRRTGPYPDRDRGGRAPSPSGRPGRSPRPGSRSAPGSDSGSPAAGALSVITGRPRTKA